MVFSSGVSPPIQSSEPHPGQAITDHEFHFGIGQIVLSLQDQNLEHGHRVKRRATALGPITVAETFNKPDTKILKVNRGIENLKRITMLAQTFKMLGPNRKDCLDSCHNPP